MLCMAPCGHVSTSTTMTKHTLHPMRRWFAFVALAFGWLAAAVSIHAQTAATGSIQGRVYNPASKEYVNNAEVRLEGTNQIPYTQSDGSSRFDNVPAGAASVTVAYTGYVS